MSSLSPDTNKNTYLLGRVNTPFRAKLGGYKLWSIKAVCVMVACLSFIFAANFANAETTVITQTTSPLNQNTANANVDVDPQVAPSPETPFNEADTDAIAESAANSNTSPDALANPNSLASQMHPSDSALSEANQQLLSQNAQLQRDVNALETQVNVLVNEHSGQLFMYGAVTVTTALLLGFVLSWFIFGRRERW